MSTREITIDIVTELMNTLDDEQLDKLFEYLESIVDRKTFIEIENEFARRETEALANDPNAKRYTSVDELFEDLLRK